MLAAWGGSRIAADALSDVLKKVRLTAATFFNVVARAPWVAEQPPRETVLPQILAGAGWSPSRGHRHDRG
jgi:cupin